MWVVLLDPGCVDWSLSLCPVRTINLEKHFLFTLCINCNVKKKIGISADVLLQATYYMSNTYMWLISHSLFTLVLEHTFDFNKNIYSSFF